MATRLQIRTALETQLATAVGIPSDESTHWQRENDSFDPPTGDLYLELSYLWGNEQLASLPAQQGTLWVYGILQVAIVAPVNSGTTDGDALADAIKQVFPADLFLVAGGQRMTIRESRAWPGLRDGAWWRTPLDITWKLRAVNPLT